MFDTDPYDAPAKKPKAWDCTITLPYDVWKETLSFCDRKTLASIAGVDKTTCDVAIFQDVRGRHYSLNKTTERNFVELAKGGGFTDYFKVSISELSNTPSLYLTP